MIYNRPSLIHRSLYGTSKHSLRLLNSRYFLSRPLTSSRYQIHTLGPRHDGYLLTSPPPHRDNRHRTGRWVLLFFFSSVVYSAENFNNSWRGDAQFVRIFSTATFSKFLLIVLLLISGGSNRLLAHDHPPASSKQQRSQCNFNTCGICITKYANANYTRCTSK